MSCSMTMVVISCQLNVVVTFCPVSVVVTFCPLSVCVSSYPMSVVVTSLPVECGYCILSNGCNCYILPKEWVCVLPSEHGCYTFAGHAWRPSTRHCSSSWWWLAAHSSPCPRWKGGETGGGRLLVLPPPWPISRTATGDAMRGREETHTLRHRCLTAANLFTRPIWAYFVCLNFQHTKIREKKKKSSISLCTCLVMCLFYSPEYAQVWVFSGTCVRFTTSHCCSVSFCIAFCVVSALISQACISTAKPK